MSISAILLGCILVATQETRPHALKYDVSSKDESGGLVLFK